MKAKSDNKKGGKGKSFEIRNQWLVWLRRKNKKKYTWDLLGDIFGVDPTTAEDIFNRDRLKYRTMPK